MAELGYPIFAGHSSSRETGVIQLNSSTSLSLKRLRYALTNAIAQGLKLAIFNSCDGLGLAAQLADLHIPQVIVMREPVPNTVAQEFLQHFLTTFSNGHSLYASVRQARERLQGLENEFPCATWLPVICQNPAEEPATWNEWCGSQPQQDSGAISPARHRSGFTNPALRTILLISVIVTGLVMGVRYLGVLQTWELQAFDQLMRLKPDEEQDQRVLVVTITEDDLQLPQQKQRHGSLSDRALAELLKN